MAGRGQIFVGPFGLPALFAKRGLESDDARTEAFSATSPVIDPSRDLGVFVTRVKPGLASPDSTGSGVAEGAKEMQTVLQQWGYAHGSH